MAKTPANLGDANHSRHRAWPLLVDRSAGKHVATDAEGFTSTPKAERPNCFIQAVTRPLPEKNSKIKGSCHRTSSVEGFCLKAVCSAGCTLGFEESTDLDKQAKGTSSCTLGFEGQGKFEAPEQGICPVGSSGPASTFLNDLAGKPSLMSCLRNAGDKSEACLGLKATTKTLSPTHGRVQCVHLGLRVHGPAATGSNEPTKS